MHHNPPTGSHPLRPFPSNHPFSANTRRHMRNPHNAASSSPPSSSGSLSRGRNSQAAPRVLMALIFSVAFVRNRFLGGSTPVPTSMSSNVRAGFR